LVGRVGCWRPEGWPGLEVGWTLRRAHWGRGYATEAARAVLAEAFGPLGIRRVVAITREANHGSRNVLGKLGFRMQGCRHVWGAEQLYFMLDRRDYNGSDG
jgi:RimJ/RimL family protein N-acetyltransferase